NQPNYDDAATKLVINGGPSPHCQSTSTFNTSISSANQYPRPTFRRNRHSNRPGTAMGACATKPKTVEGKVPEEGLISTPKVAPEATTPTNKVAADDAQVVVVEKVVEETKEEPAAAVETELPAAPAEPEQKAEVVSEAIVEHEHKEEEEEVVEKIVEEEKPSSTPAKEITTAEVAAAEPTEVKAEPTEVKKADTEEEGKEKPAQS
ncbi:hypothetical protein U9M48_030034, partial [Paspalum notatum var. saurae]